jgi:hypothetical protein
MRGGEGKDGVVTCRVAGRKSKVVSVCVCVRMSETDLRWDVLWLVSQSHVHTCRGNADPSITVKKARFEREGCKRQ